MEVLYHGGRAFSYRISQVYGIHYPSIDCDYRHRLAAGFKRFDRFSVLVEVDPALDRKAPVTN